MPCASRFMYVTNRREDFSNEKMTMEPDSTIPLRVSYSSHVVSLEGPLSTVFPVSFPRLRHPRRRLRRIHHTTRYTPYDLLLRPMWACQSSPSFRILDSEHPVLRIVFEKTPPVLCHSILVDMSSCASFVQFKLQMIELCE